MPGIPLYRDEQGYSCLFRPVHRFGFLLSLGAVTMLWYAQRKWLTCSGSRGDGCSMSSNASKALL